MWDSYGKVSYCFLEDMLTNTGLQGSTLSSHCMTMVLVPLNSRPVAYYRKGGNIVDGCFSGVSVLGWGATLSTHWLSPTRVGKTCMEVPSLHEKMRLSIHWIGSRVN